MYKLAIVAIIFILLWRARQRNVVTSTVGSKDEEKMTDRTIIEAVRRIERQQAAWGYAPAESWRWLEIAILNADSNVPASTWERMKEVLNA